jgi:Holliday junction resolvase
MRGAARHRRKGDWAERELIALHKQIGIIAERYPASGATHLRGSGHDLDVYARGREAAPLVAECKARKHGTGFTTLESWLGDFDILFATQSRACRRATSR